MFKRMFDGSAFRVTVANFSPGPWSSNATFRRLQSGGHGSFAPNMTTMSKSLVPPDALRTGTPWLDLEPAKDRRASRRVLWKYTK